ncbi:MAG: carbon-nitrogen hydrolase [Gammaproteobacteria bacterium]
MACSEDPEANLAKAIEMTREAVAQGARIICLPELFRSRYFCQVEDHDYFRLAEAVPGPSTEAFSQLAAELDVVVMVSLFERRGAGLYHNTTAVIDGARGYLGKYRKMHIPDDPRYFEKFYFTPGDLGFQTFFTSKAPVGTLVCWDQWFPEAARLTALRGAEILFYPTAIGWHPEEKVRFGQEQHEAWELMQRSHAVANGCYVVAVNRIGFEPMPGDPPAGGASGIEFWGQSFVAGPDGVVIARLPVDEEVVRVIPVDLGRPDEVRVHWPFLRDRRIDAYHDLTRRYIDPE